MEEKICVEIKVDYSILQVKTKTTNGFSAAVVVLVETAVAVVVLVYPTVAAV